MKTLLKLMLLVVMSLSISAITTELPVSKSPFIEEFLTPIETVVENNPVQDSVEITYDGAPIYIQPPKSNDIYKGKFSDVECLALNIYFEARGESTLGQELVAQVTMNRYRMTAYQDTICGVVKARKQFSWTHDGKSDKPKDLVSYTEAMIIAIKFMFTDYIVDYPNAEQLTNFHALKKMPDSWKGHVTYVGKVGNHTFYTQSRTMAYTEVSLLKPYTTFGENHVSLRI